MCDVLLPPGVNPTAVKYIYISHHKYLHDNNGKVKHSHYSPMRPTEFWEVKLPDSVTSAFEGGKLLALRKAVFTPGVSLYSF
jgi:hypothetical protein